ncbi:MAG TPA: hypothetical protein VK432_08670 [Stellaceae bacterium]|nr:hypothetical protein [Stellaceae bacterium]
MLIDQAKQEIWALFCSNSRIWAAIDDGLLGFGSAEANRQQKAYYWAKNAELLTIITSWGR